MPIPYHTHTFEIPAATKQEVAAGIVTDKVVVPATLGSASTAKTDDFATAEQGRKADNAVPKTLKIGVGDGLNGGGVLSNDIKIELSEITKNSLKKADDAFPAGDAGSLARKNKIEISDISAGGATNSNSFLCGDGSWKVPDTTAADMRKSVYDPRGIGKDIFNSDNITEGTTHLFLTASERAQIAAYLKSLNSFIGLAATFALAAAPDGWLEANGELINRDDAPLLWAVVQKYGGAVSEADWTPNSGAYSTGDGSKTFRLPDLRGEIIRGLDNGRGIDSGRTLGSVQGDAIRNISGNFGEPLWPSAAIFTENYGGAIQALLTTNNRRVIDSIVTQTDSSINYPLSLNFNASLVVPTANENRPRNVAQLMCIRYL